MTPKEHIFTDVCGIPRLEDRFFVCVAIGGGFWWQPVATNPPLVAEMRVVFVTNTYNLSEMRAFVSETHA